MELKTHLKLNKELNGELIVLDEGYAKVELKTLESMVADEQGLVHGGFMFCAADFTAMAVVNDPYVVLAKSETKFLAPVKVGQNILFEGKIVQNNGRKQSIEVVGSVKDQKVFIGTFYTAVLEKHVLEF